MSRQISGRVSGGTHADIELAAYGLLSDLQFRWACLALAGAAFFLELPRHRGKPPLDLGGMVLIAIATTCLVLFATWGGSKYEWNDPLILGLIVGTILAAAAVVRVERRFSGDVAGL